MTAVATTVNVDYSERVNKLINDLLPPKDVLDEAQFDAIGHMNSTFPEEESLVGLDAFIARLRRDIAQVDRDLLRAVKTESMIGGKPDDDLAAARQTVRELIGEADHIKQRASRIDVLADSIGKDVRSLDAAKRNLTSSITALRDLAELEDRTHTLQAALDSGDYKQAADALKDARDLLRPFEPHRTAAPRVAALSRRMELFTGRLYAHATKHAWPQLDPMRNQEGVGVFELGLALARALGPGDFVKHFTAHQIDNYRAAFKPDPPALGDVQRRFDWLWALFRGLEDRLPFPSDWCLLQELAVDFCVQTTHDLQEQLVQEQSAGRLDIPTLEIAVAKTRAFEKMLTLKFQQGRVRDLTTDSSEDGMQRKADEQRRNRANDSAAAGSGNNGNNRNPQREYKFTWISACFERYVLGLYPQQEAAMGKYMAEALEAETWQPSTENATLLESAVQLVLFLCPSCTSCVRLSTGEYLLALTGLWSKHLTSFATRLEATLGQRRGLTDGDYTAVCLIVNSAAYLRDRSLELEDQVLACIDELYRRRVQVEELAPTFVAVVGKGLKQLVRMVGAELDPHFQAITTTNWGTVTAVGDVSEYASRLDGLIAERTKHIAGYLSRDYTRVFCEKLGESVASRFSAQIYRCKRISIPGGQQLLQDAQHVRAALLNLAEPGRFTDTQRQGYQRTVKAEMLKTENVLKIVLQPPHSGDLAEQYAAHVANPSIPDFLRLMEIKGLRREEVQRMVTALQQKGVPATEVVPPEDDESARRRDIVDMFKDLVPRAGFKFFS